MPITDLKTTNFIHILQIYLLKIFYGFFYTIPFCSCRSIIYTGRIYPTSWQCLPLWNQVVLVTTSLCFIVISFNMASVNRAIVCKGADNCFTCMNEYRSLFRELIYRARLIDIWPSYHPKCACSVFHYSHTSDTNGYPYSVCVIFPVFSFLTVEKDLMRDLIIDCRNTFDTFCITHSI